MSIEPVTDLILRDAVVDDAGAIAGVHVRSWRAAYRGLLPAELLDGLDLGRRTEGWRTALTSPEPGAATLVAERAGAVVAFAAVGPSRDADGAGTGEVLAIYADPAHFSTGAGRPLMAAAVDRLRGAGYAEATLWVLAGNARATGFYTAAGWTEDGTVKQDTVAGEPVTEQRWRRPL